MCCPVVELLQLSILQRCMVLTTTCIWFCRAHNALKLAQQQGAADKISFSTLINAYGKRQDFAKMEETLWEMQNAGLGGSLEAFNSMLDSYGKASQLEKLEDVLDRMAKAGYKKDLSTYNILINVYGRKGMLSEMEDLFRVLQVSL